MIINYNVTITHEDFFSLKNSKYKSEIPPVTLSHWAIKHYGLDRKIALLKYALKRQLPKNNITVSQHMFGLNVWKYAHNYTWTLKQTISTNVASPLEITLNGWDGRTVPFNLSISLDEEFLKT